jgi:hypothetical protein
MSSRAISAAGIPGPQSSQPAMTASSSASPASGPRRLARRDVRVVLLVSLVLLMCAVDLVVTLNYLTTAGFNEANPLARWIMQYNCAWILAGWKLLLTTITCGLLCFTRRHLSGEIGAWVCLGVMLWLMARWHTYSDSAHSTVEFRYGAEHANVEFVRFDSGE